MVELFGKQYYIDIETISTKCQTGNTFKNDGGSDTPEINIFKYEIIKVCLERVLGEFQETDDDVGAFAQGNLSVSFNLAFNTLLKYEIIIEDEYK